MKHKCFNCFCSLAVDLGAFSLICNHVYLYLFSSDSFGGLQSSASRGLGLSRVSQQDLDLVRNGYKLVTSCMSMLHIWIYIDNK